MQTEDGAPEQSPDRDPTTATRASDQERERAVEVLREAAGDGRLTFEELTDRVDAALRATTRDELERLTADLPDATAPARRPAAGHEVAVPTRQSTVFGDVRRSGEWTVPERSSWRTCFGDVVLDLREARVGMAEMTIDAGTVFGDVQLLVPEGVAVEVRSRTVFGSVRQDAGDAAQPGAPRVILVGGTVFGDVRVRAHRLRERLALRLLERG
jgi:hypothetical protein